MATRRIQKELSELNRNPPAGVSAGPIDGDMLNWQGTILGPQNSPYKGGIFRLKIEFSQEYPFKPPAIKFITKVYHPNIDEDGSICVGLLKSDVWKPATKIAQVLESIASLLENPNPDDALATAVAEVYNTNKTKYIKNVKEYVRKYASA